MTPEETVDLLLEKRVSRIFVNDYTDLSLLKEVILRGLEVRFPELDGFIPGVLKDSKTRLFRTNENTFQPCGWICDGAGFSRSSHTILMGYGLGSGASHHASSSSRNYNYNPIIIVKHWRE